MRFLMISVLFFCIVNSNAMQFRPNETAYSYAVLGKLYTDNGTPEDSERKFRAQEKLIKAVQEARTSLNKNEILHIVCRYLELKDPSSTCKRARNCW